MDIAQKMSLLDLTADQLTDKKVLIRVDFNVPLDDTGKITNNARIRAAIPTIQYVLEKKPKAVILMSHCGRPDGEVVKKYSLRPVSEELAKLLGKSVMMLDDCVGAGVEAAVNSAKEGQVILLENLRFHLAEEGKNKKSKATAEEIATFSGQLTQLGDVFVNDAFGTAHRPHASMVKVDLPIKVAGLLMEKELKYFAKVLSEPEHPFLAILGGAKVSDKIQLINNLIDKVDTLIIGGGMAYTFLKHAEQPMSIGMSLYDKEGAKIVGELVRKANEKNVKLVFPVDFTISNKFGEDGIIKTVTREEGIPDDFEGLDCGPKSIEIAREIILKSKLICWNGPQGVFEMKSFAKGSVGFLDAVVEATKAGATSVVGGGDTATLVENEGKAELISHVSTGGGASLELLEGKVLPGVAALSDK